MAGGVDASTSAVVGDIAGETDDGEGSDDGDTLDNVPLALRAAAPPGSLGGVRPSVRSASM